MKAQVPVLFVVSALLLTACQYGEDHATIPSCAEPGSFFRIEALIPEAARNFLTEQTKAPCAESGTNCQFTLIKDGGKLGAFGVSVIYTYQQPGSTDCLDIPGAGYTWYFDRDGVPTHDFPDL